MAACVLLTNTQNFIKFIKNVQCFGPIDHNEEVKCMISYTNMLCKEMFKRLRDIANFYNFFSFQIDVTLKFIYLTLLLKFFHMVLKKF
jgi:hypothetical protein